ncbi:MAG TPA: ankyrin repeat domain-containing protein [Tepidisphaeraceae bacterium]|nr:ankyrin repeat domain-containing protein [Tepidisphaeraceae bacterium]
MTDKPEALAILAAAKAGDVAAVENLLKENRRLVHARDKWHYTPLHLAANVAVARLLIDSGARVNSRGWMGSTPLHKAASAGQADVVELLIQHGAKIHARRPERGDMPLHWAANEKVARLLKEDEMDVYARDKSGRTPLHWAAQSGHTETAKYLIDSGADVNARDEPFVAISAASKLIDQCVRRVERLPWLRPLMKNVINARYTGDTPLHCAAREGRDEVVELLLKSGAEVDAADDHGRTPLHWAAFRGQDAVIERLVQAGADLNLRNKDGQKPIHSAKGKETKALLARLMGFSATAEVSLSRAPADHKREIHRIYIHPTRSEAVVVAHNAVLSRWALGERAEFITSLETRHSWISDLAALPNGKFISSAVEGLEIRNWEDLRVCDSLSHWEPLDRPRALAVSNDGRWLAVAEFPERVVLIDRSTGKATARVKADEQATSVQFSPDSRLLATACSSQGGGHIRLDAVGSDGQLTPVTELERHFRPPPAKRFVDVLVRVRFSPDSRSLALFETGSLADELFPLGWRGNLVVYDVDSGEERWVNSIDSSFTKDRRTLRSAGHAWGLFTEVTFAGEGKVVACGGTKGSIVFFSTASGKFLGRRVVHPKAAVVALAHEPSTGRIWAGLENGEINSVDIK